jgi:hypothetical protein
VQNESPYSVQKFSEWFTKGSFIFVEELLEFLGNMIESEFILDFEKPLINLKSFFFVHAEESFVIDFINIFIALGGEASLSSLWHWLV